MSFDPQTRVAGATSRSLWTWVILVSAAIPLLLLVIFERADAPRGDSPLADQVLDALGRLPDSFMTAVILGALLIGIFGGGILASVRRKPAWWAATVVSLCCAPYWGLIFALSGMTC